MRIKVMDVLNSLPPHIRLLPEDAGRIAVILDLVVRLADGESVMAEEIHQVADDARDYAWVLRGD